MVTVLDINKLDSHYTSAHTKIPRNASVTPMPKSKGIPTHLKQTPENRTNKGSKSQSHLRTRSMHGRGGRTPVCTAIHRRRAADAEWKTLVPEREVLGDSLVVTVAVGDVQVGEVVWV